jgi:hypothetical protein
VSFGLLAGCLCLAVACAELEDEDPVPELSVTRDLRIDANAESLSPVGWIAVLSDGAIAVSQRQDGEILFFSADGSRLSAFGRSGDGPGEFRRLGGYGLVGDTLWVGDPSAGRTTLISRDRTLAGTRPWLHGISLEPPLEGVRPSFFMIRPIALLPDSAILTEPILAAGSESLAWPGGTFPGDPIVRVRVDGTFDRVIAWIPENECVVRIIVQGGSGVTDIPLCARAQRAVAVDGSRIAFAIPGAETEGGRYSLVVIGAAGDTILSRQYSHSLVPIPKPIMDSIMARRLEQAQGPELKDAYQSMKPPGSYPPFTRILVGRDNTIWLELFTLSGDRIWQVFDSRGDLLGRVALPRSVFVHAAEESAIWGTDTDDDGLEHVVRYRISR